MEEKRIALLIDSDNVSADYIDLILDKVNEEGVTTYRRIYGDWTRTETKKWKSVLLENSITPIQQFSNTKGKNSTDISLIIDAMDILYSGKVDGFCIVSSDSDFTKLASRLRESGMRSGNASQGYKDTHRRRIQIHRSYTGRSVSAYPAR